MADTPEPEANNQVIEPPAPEVLKPQADMSNPAPENVTPTDPKEQKKAKRRHGTYRPSHKATFIGLAVAVAILLVNVLIIGFVLKGQSEKDSHKDDVQVTLSQEVLEKLGVNRSVVGDSGIELVINPDTQFSGQVQVGGDVSVAGKLSLNGEFSAATAAFGGLQGGNTSVNELNVSGNATASTLALRSDLEVAGSTRLQGPVTVNQLLTVNNNINVAGNLAIGGTLSIGQLHTGTLVVDTNLVTGGHIITQGAAPSVSVGGAVGSNGTVSISGNDIAGTVAVNIGAGAVAGTLATITFHTKYANTPHVVITPIGGAVDNFYINRSTTGFTIITASALPPGGYSFDFVVHQ